MEPNATLPLRSTLHSLQPIGVGSPFAESADSYMTRLARSHAVERSKLHRFVNERGDRIFGDLRGQPARIDAPTPNALSFMQRTARLVSQPQVALLGLGWLEGGVSSQQCLRKRRAWCPHCFRQMRLDGQPSYAPLQWDFVQVTHCAIHEYALRDRCARCGKQCSVARERTPQVGLCGSCGEALEVNVDEELIEAAPVATKESRAVSEQLGLLISSAQLGRLRCSTFATLIVRLHRAGHAVSASELARRMGCSKGTISDLMKGRGQPSLHFLLRLATALAVPLPDLLHEPHETGGGRALGCVHHEPIVWQSRARPRKNWTDIQRALEFEAVSAGFISFPKLARKVGVDAKHLGVTLPEQMLVHRRKKHAAVESERKAKVARAAAMIEEASRAGLTSKRQVASAIGIGRTRRCFKTAWAG